PELPVLLVLAGHGGNSREFASVAADLEDRWRVVGVDARGSGGSDWLPADRGYSQQQWARDLVEVLQQTGMMPTAAIGVSLGGMLIMDLHEAGAIALERAVVVDVPPEFPQPTDPEAMAEQMATTQRLLGATYPDVDAITDAWREVRRPAWPDVDAEFLAHSAAAWTTKTDSGWRFACDVDGYMMRPPSEPPILDRWASWESLTSTTDTLVVRGALSEALVENTFVRMVVGERTTGLVVAEVGHCPPLELEPTRSTVTDWLT
ncbi:MAG: alpha/beta hydrolase, partial [Actinomycetota bacterium]